MAGQWFTIQTADHDTCRSRRTGRPAGAENDLAVGTVSYAYNNTLADWSSGQFKTEAINEIGPWKSGRKVEWETFNCLDCYGNPRLLGAISYASAQKQAWRSTHI